MARKTFLKLFQRCNPGDIRIRHHFTDAPLYLHSFKHKGYWYHGKKREEATMKLFSQLIRTGDTVIEVGGHIGYISIYFSSLVGEQGKVIIFEPGENNLPYIRKNLIQYTNAEIITKAVSNVDGTATFYLEDLTGQNNTLLRDYTVFSENQNRAGIIAAYQTTTVETIRLDTFFVERDVAPNFVKIDVEGAEYQVLAGAQLTLQTCKPMIMVEITQQHTDVVSVLVDHGYMLLTPDLKKYDGMHDGNVFALHQVYHKRQISELLAVFNR